MYKLTMFFKSKTLPLLCSLAQFLERIHKASLRAFIAIKHFNVVIIDAHNNKRSGISESVINSGVK